GAAMDVLRASICSDLEELLNTRRRWRSWDPQLAQLERSLVGFGLPDFASGAFHDPRRREELRALIEACIRRFEPRIVSLKVTLLEATDKLSGTLRLRIDAQVRAPGRGPTRSPSTPSSICSPRTSRSSNRRHRWRPSPCWPTSTASSRRCACWPANSPNAIRRSPAACD